MKHLAIGTVFIAAMAMAIYVLGRADGTSACEKQRRNSLSNALDVQVGIERENAHITDTLIKNTTQHTRVTEAVKQERKAHAKTQPDHSACYVSRGNVQLLNAQRSNQMPDDLHPRLGIGDDSQPSTVSQHALIDGDIDCAAQYNKIKDRCSSLIARVKVLKEAIDATAE